jgi:drug/metabolite transporter (DMT)-like permease
MHVLKGILLKLASALLFAVMSALIRGFGDAIPVGQVVFFRSAFAIVPVVLIYAARRELATAVRTGRPFGHVGRGIISVLGMFLSFAALVRLPLVDAELIELMAIGVLGGISHILLTESYRFAPASLLAPFDYTAMVWAFVLGYAMFGETPTALVFLGALIIAAAGLFVIWRERRLGIERARARAKARTPTPG